MKKIIILFYFLTSCFCLIGQQSDFAREIRLTTPRLNGEDVLNVQKILFELGYTEVGDADGWFGPKSEKAVLNFQNDYYLKQSGIVDVDNWILLNNRNIKVISKILQSKNNMDSRSDLLTKEYEYEKEYADGRGYPVGFYVTQTLDDQKLLKISIRITMDGSGYIYTAYYNNNQLMLIDYIYWGYDFIENKNENRLHNIYLINNKSIIAKCDIKYNKWDLESNIKDDEFINDVLEYISTAIEEEK